MKRVIQSDEEIVEKRLCENRAERVEKRSLLPFIVVHSCMIKVV